MKKSEHFLTYIGLIIRDAVDYYKKPRNVFIFCSLAFLAAEAFGSVLLIVMVIRKVPEQNPILFGVFLVGCLFVASIGTMVTMMGAKVFMESKGTKSQVVPNLN